MVKCQHHREILLTLNLDGRYHPDVSEQARRSPANAVRSQIFLNCGGLRYHQRILTIGMKEEAINIGM
jgi:hypothetical protein